MVQWESELKTVMSVMTQSRCYTGVDTMIWRIGSFYAESVWRTLNRDLRKPTNTVALGRVRRSEISESLSAPHFTEISKSDYSLSMRTLFIIPLVLMSLVSFPSWGLTKNELVERKSNHICFWFFQQCLFQCKKVFACYRHLFHKARKCRNLIHQRTVFFVLERVQGFFRDRP